MCSDYVERSEQGAEQRHRDCGSSGFVESVRTQITRRPQVAVMYPNGTWLNDPGVVLNTPVEGGPGGINSDRYTIIAKAKDAGADVPGARRDIDTTGLTGKFNIRLEYAPARDRNSGAAWAEARIGQGRRSAVGH